MIKIEKINKKTKVFDINVENNHNFYANDILVHNCQEINLPTSPIYDVNGEEGEIALCVLGAINLGTIKGFDELEEICEYTVRMLDYIIDIQDYPVAAAKKMLKRRSLGVGVTNLAYWLAKNNLDYTNRSLVEIDRLFEHIQFNLLKASNKLAKEYGKCEYFDRTKYSKGLLPIDHYSKSVDTIVSRELECDWESLRKDILEFGLRNSVVSAQMPCESSSVVSSSTNGIEAPRKLISVKKSKSGSPLPVVVPEISRLKNKYSFSWGFNNDDMNNVVAVIQKYFDQGISVNHYYDKKKYGLKMPSDESDYEYTEINLLLNAKWAQWRKENVKKLSQPQNNNQDGYKYCLVVVDDHSRKCDAVALKQKDSETIAKGLKEIFSRGIV
jgi:ribonucleoside-diphosphate reductase alpha chain